LFFYIYFKKKKKIKKEKNAYPKETKNLLNQGGELLEGLLRVFFRKLAPLTATTLI